MTEAQARRTLTVRAICAKRASLPSAVLVVVLCWEVLGRLPLRGARVFPPISGILSDLMSARDLYADHVGATVVTSLCGLSIGAAVACLAAVAFCLSPPMERLFHGVNIALFALPSIALGPLLVLVVDGRWPQIILSAAMVYYPVMAAVLLGLRDIDPRNSDLVRAYGGGCGALLRFVRLRNAIPSSLAGLRVAASVSVLGAILGEFGSGERWGLGSFLLASLGQANAERLWGISIVSAAIALAGYGFFAALGRRYAGATAQVTVAATRQIPDVVPSRSPIVVRLLTSIGSTLLPFTLWWLLLKLLRLSAIVAPDPLDTFDYIFSSSDSNEVRGILLHALGATLPVALLGLVAGLTAAFALAAVSVLAPRVTGIVLPLAMVLQNTPLVALTPIILLLFGRSLAASLAMAVLVVFFPAYVMLAQGFASVPGAGLDLVRAYGGGRLKQFAFVSVPFSRNYLIAAAKLVAPRALLGVMVAEWLLTGTGLGALMDVSRGTLDYGMIWSGAVVSILASVAVYELIAFVGRLSSAPTESL